MNGYPTNAIRSVGQNVRRERKGKQGTDSEARRDIFIKKIAVLLICVLFYANVMPIVAETPETTEARIAGKNDAKGFQWEWFAASYMTTNASVIAIALVYWFSESYLFSALDTMHPACLLTMYGIYILTPTAVALIDSPTPPAGRLLGKSPE